MTDRTPAETLTAAAEKLRALIADHELPTEPWLMDPSDPEVIVNPGGAELITAYTPSIASYAAALHPGVGAALADWLDAHAPFVAAIAAREPESNLVRQALAAARQILGEAS